MSEDRRKLNKHSTGTVPKVKYSVKCRNNMGQQHYSERDNWRNLPNNLSTEWPTTRSESSFVRNSQLTNFETMDTPLEGPHQNGVYGNGTAASSHTSSSNSRRNSGSTVPKCDNVTKYPNKKQIEDKLSQIREYIHITTSLMSSMKNSDEQTVELTDDMSSTIEALKDSEAKLSTMLVNSNNENCEYIGENSADVKNGFEEQANREILRETQNVSLQHLKQRGDCRLREARQAQERLAQGHVTNSNRTENNLQEYDLAIAELEETTKRLNGVGVPKQEVININQPEEERFIHDEIEELENQIQVMHNANVDRNKLIQILDKRDAELRCQHMELQNKLSELQTKKSQVDHLVAALQNSQAPEDDIGSHVRKIVSMKDQLAKLKDMLEMVENTEELMQNVAQEEQANGSDIYNKAENCLNKDILKGNCSNQSQVENHLPLQYENRSSSSVNVDNRSKLTNKNSRDTSSQCNETNLKIGEKMALQAELKAKKRELEEIMGKHKASSSNLNHDVGTDNKSEFSCSNSMFDNVSGIWAPLLPSHHNQPDSSDRYSSDEGTEDVNEYSGIHPSQQNQPILRPMNSTGTNVGKYGSERHNSSEFVMGQSYDRLCQPLFRSPEGNARGSTVEANSAFSRGSSVSNLEQVGKQNMQKQLELIRSVCDSMLPQSTANQSNVHHLRNNLTPSPMYPELRQFSSPNPHSMNALNVVNPPPENAWFAAQQNPSFSDAANYQNWLTTNTLQTQAFMLNSLNQCCQMLWLQQRELANLRGAVTALQQERLPSPHYNNENQMVSPLNQNLNSNQLEPTPTAVMNQGIPPLNLCAPNVNQCRPMNSKMNQVSTACSLPNLNQYNSAPVTMDPIFSNHNNLRLMDSPLNNMNNLDHVRNMNMATLQGANDNINPLPGHIWNGQALNNQVPPGNRANNYWDNFRSYSRQNLFSTKSNDGIQNSPLMDRTHNATLRSGLLDAHSVPKSNSQIIASAPQEHSPQRSCVKPSRRYTNSNIAVVPPDVLNINQNIKTDGLPLTPIQNENRGMNESDSNSSSHSLFPNNTSRTPGRNPSNMAIAVENSQHPRRRNDSANHDGNSKSKLFEELRENVYREVASLISANEARPHFLIQLFRDLQLVSSDPLRLKTLQSIQTLISQSLRNSHNPNVQESSPNEEIPSTLNEFSMQSTVWSPIPPNSVPRNATILEGLISKKGSAGKNQDIFHEIIPFLNDNEHLTINQHFLATLKQKIMEAKSFRKVVKDTIFQKHFSNVLDDLLCFYNEKPLCAVKSSLLQSIRDLLDRELSFMNLIQSTGESQLNDLVLSNPPPNLLELRYPLNSEDPGNAATVQIQNGDLAEADQSHVEDEDVEEEGAVGGLLEAPLEQITSITEMSNKNEAEQSSSVEAFTTSTEAESQYQLGLDQVPTRLATKSKSRSNTPNKDRASKHDDNLK